jgi:hypothetical protein
MLTNSEDLFKFNLHAKDGNIGHCQDILFNDQTWKTRHFIASTKGWISGKQVLLPPRSFSPPNFETHIIDVDLTRDEIQKSPLPSEDLPLSAQIEKSILDYYKFKKEEWGEQGAVDPNKEAQLSSENQQQNPALRSAKEIIGYKIHAADGNIGHVEHLLFDKDWQIRYIVINTSILGLTIREIVLSPDWVTEINWAENSLYTNHTVTEIKKCPSYVPRKFQREEEIALHRHFGKKGYWH